MQQANSKKHDQERWEDLLNTIFARVKKIKEIRISTPIRIEMENYMMKAGYDPITVGLWAVDQRNLWGIPIIDDETAGDWVKIVYIEGILSPEPNPQPKKDKPVDVWLDNEV